jgi:hypothetical protein
MPQLRVARPHGAPAAPSTIPLAALVLLGGLTVPATGRAQVRVGLYLGPVASTRLLRDSILEPVSVRANPSLAAAVSAETTLQGGYRAGLRLTASRSDVETHSPSQGSARVTTLTLWHPAGFLRHPITPWLVAEARIGLIIFAPSQRAGTLFREGASPRPALGLGLGVQRALGRHMALEAFTTYDVHRFSTAALRAAGFTGETVVHRFGLQVGLHRVLRDAADH